MDAVGLARVAVRVQAGVASEVEARFSLGLAELLSAGGEGSGVLVDLVVVHVGDVSEGEFSLESNFEVHGEELAELAFWVET